MSEVTRYLAFGIKISSQITFKELPMSMNHVNKSDLDILLVNLSTTFSLFKNNGEIEFISESNSLLLHVPNIVVFKIENGNSIKVHILDENKLNIIRMFILGTCIGICLMQNKILPLHGSAIKIDGKAYAFIGHSGAGKSTLASAFIQKGYNLLTDDVIAVRVSNPALPSVIPAYPQQKLWQESLDQFGMNSNEFSPLFERETKFAVPVSNSFCNSELPLGGIFELTINSDEKLTVQPINKLTALKTMYVHTYRNFLLTDMNLLDWHFRNSAKILERVFMYQISRPLSKFTANELVGNIVDCILKEEAYVESI